MLSFDELDFFDDGSDDGGSESGYPGTSAFTICSSKYISSSGESVGYVRGVGSRFFVLT